MTECPKCQGRMSEGFAVDKGHYNAQDLQTWVEGAPVKTFWRGLHTKGREAYTISTYRCERCGYLESYANTPVE